MSLHFLVAIVGALVAAAGTGVVGARCVREPGAALIAFTGALLVLTVSLGAQALGYEIGFGPLAFRAMEVGAQVLAPLALAIGLAEVAGKTVVSRFAARLLLTGLGIVALVIFATDPLSSSPFTKAWPATTVYYQIVPNKLLEYILAPAVVIVALIAMGVVAVKPSREQAWRDALPAVGSGGVAALLLAVPGIVALLGVSLPVASLFTPLCLLAAATTWFAGQQAGRLRFDVMRQEAERLPPEQDWDARPAWAGHDATGDFDRLAADDDEFGIYRNGSPREHDDLDYRGSSGYREPGTGDFETGGYLEDENLYREPAAPRYDEPYQDGHPYQDERQYQEESPYQERRQDYHDGPYRDELGAASSAQRDLFGQIAIYTLLEDRVEDFDRLTRRVVKEVRTHEPDTLVYIVHAVPSAPMQRILYEVYSDRDAYETHKRQPYVAQFEAERRPYVLATNIIELGLQQAKVSPLPSVADLLQDTGFDLLSDTGFGIPGYGPRRPGGAGGGGSRV
ncbi:MAG TPA: antibiotic biosynthesis monooxygenase [Streptosporangiaceae bacterium]|nr:antibiotic biosynthesis monooxygenase [Streptosporangiaceae bacterium]